MEGRKGGGLARMGDGLRRARFHAWMEERKKLDV